MKLADRLSECGRGHAIGEMSLRPLPGVDAALIALKCTGRNRFNLHHSAFARQSRKVRAMKRHANGDIVGYGRRRSGRTKH
jgi:hypothetical protein